MAEKADADMRARELAALLADVAQRKEAAFRRLYERSSAKLFAVIRRITVSEAAAEEALQEAFLRIWDHADRFDPALASPMTWMTTIARHTAIDSIRRGGERIASAAVEIDEVLADRLAAPEVGSDVLASRELRRCIDGMEADRRGMVLLAYCYGWSREELSRRFDRPVATVKTLLRRSLMSLKECLGGG